MSVLLRGCADFQGLDDGVEVVAAGAQGNGHADGVVEGHAAHGVLLPQQQVGQADADGAAVFVLVQRPGGRSACCPETSTSSVPRRLVSSSNCLT